MPRLNDRMTRAAAFSDGRLMRVSRDARLLVGVLEALAEPTGCLKLDPDEIRTPVALYLADADGTPPSREQVSAWVEELIAAQWIVAYRTSPRLGYLQGFGVRQTGMNVCLGFSTTTGEINPHLPLPACVTLQQAKNSKGELMPKMLPVHCSETWDSCPCEEVARASAPPPDDSPTPTRPRKRKELEPKEREPNVLDGKAVKPHPKGGDAGEGTPTLPAYLLDLLKEQSIPIPSGETADKLPTLLAKLGRAQGEEAMRRAIADARKQNHQIDADWLTFYAEASGEKERAGNSGRGYTT